MMQGRELKTVLTADTTDFRRELDRSSTDAREWVRDLNAEARRIRIAEELDREMDESRRETGENARELGQEFGENLGEGLRAGDPAGVIIESFTSLTNGFSGVTGKLVAIGAGLVTAVVYGWKQNEDRLKELGYSTGLALGDALADGLSAAELRRSLVDAISEDMGAGAFTELGRAAEATGTSVDDFVSALAAGGQVSRDYERVLREIINQNTTYTKRGRGTTASVTETGKAAQFLTRMLRQQSGVADTARTEAEFYADAMDGTKKSNRDAAREIDTAAGKLGRQAREAAAAARELERYREQLEGLGISGVGDAGTPLLPKYLPGNLPRKRRHRGDGTRG